jgi:hypothetical protein
MHIITAVREFFEPGVIDVDPCSCSAANERIGALCFFDYKMDGLDTANEWHGNVFANPPFGVRDGNSMQGLFLSRVVSEYEAGKRGDSAEASSGVQEVVLLLKASVGFEWFKEVFKWPHCFISERLAFVDGRGNREAEGRGLKTRAQNPHGSVLVYIGSNDKLFAEKFGHLGFIPGTNSWPLA